MLKTLFSGRRKFVAVPLVVIIGLTSLGSFLSTPNTTDKAGFSAPVSTVIPTIVPTDTPTSLPTPSLSPTPIPTIALKPTAKPSVARTQPTAVPQVYYNNSVRPSSGYACDCSKTCTEISSCAEAQYQLKNCGCKQRDNDSDGIACDGKPLNCQK